MMTNTGIADLSPEILFHIFCNLNCFEIVDVRRVCKDWYRVFEDNKALWRAFQFEQGEEEEDKISFGFPQSSSCSVKSLVELSRWCHLRWNISWILK